MGDDGDGATPVALSILGLGKDAARATALEDTLRHVTGVVRAYVSPFTELAYLDYRPVQISEDQLVLAILDAGYRVDASAKRFAWRHT